MLPSRRTLYARESPAWDTTIRRPDLTSSVRVVHMPRNPSKARLAAATSVSAVRKAVAASRSSSSTEPLLTASCSRTGNR